MQNETNGEPAKKTNRQIDLSTLMLLQLLLTPPKPADPGPPPDAPEGDPTDVPASTIPPPPEGGFDVNLFLEMMMLSGYFG